MSQNLGVGKGCELCAANKIKNKYIKMQQGLTIGRYWSYERICVAIVDCLVSGTYWRFSVFVNVNKKMEKRRKPLNHVLNGSQYYEHFDRLPTHPIAVLVHSQVAHVTEQNDISVLALAIHADAAHRIFIYCHRSLLASLCSLR